jgi:hypothetical protein
MFKEIEQLKIQNYQKMLKIRIIQMEISKFQLEDKTTVWLQMDLY